jgi:hypothetical protein
MIYKIIKMFLWIDSIWDKFKIEYYVYIIVMWYILFTKNVYTKGRKWK